MFGLTRSQIDCEPSLYDESRIVNPRVIFNLDFPVTYTVRGAILRSACIRFCRLRPCDYVVELTSFHDSVWFSGVYPSLAHSPLYYKNPRYSWKVAVFLIARRFRWLCYVCSRSSISISSSRLNLTRRVDSCNWCWVCPRFGHSPPRYLKRAGSAMAT